MAEMSVVHPPPPPRSPPSQASGSSEMEDAPESSLQQLRDIIRDLTEKEEEYISLLHQREEPERVIEFINAIYYADQYWDLKQYLRDLPIVYTRGLFFDIYLKMLKESGKNFDLKEEDLRYGVYFHTMELSGALQRKRKAERQKVKLMELYGDKKMYTEEEQSRADSMLPLDFQYEPQTDTYALSNPIWKLVLRARKNEYVMDKDPLKELKRHNGVISPFYLESRREYLENTVILPNVSGHTYVQDVEKLLSSCGEIAYSKLESGKGKIRTVYVTFYDPQGANLALKKKTLRVRGRDIVIKTLQSELSHEVKDDVGVLANFTQLPADVKDKCAENVNNGGKSSKKHKRGGRKCQIKSIKEEA